MIDDEESFKIMEFKEADSYLEKHKKDVIEKYIEYEIAIMQDFKDQGKSFDEYIDYTKTILWNIKDQRAQIIKKELGM